MEVNLIEKFRFIWRAWRYLKRLDPYGIDFLLKNLSKGDTALDIGAHKGAYSYWMHKAVGNAGKVFSFEPQPPLCDYLKKLARQLRLSSLVVECIGISSSDGVSELTVPSKRRGEPSPGATLEQDGEFEDHYSLNVNVKTLDSYFENRDSRPIRLIKCDVEGHELEVFRGGERILKKDMPILLFECEQRHHKVDSVWNIFDYLMALGYQGYFFLNGDLRPIREFDVGQLQDIEGSTYIANFIFQK
ncbi:MAG: FkbM family methyltransferase [Thermodesulfobacteriota bacterium]|nr:FkbM family methyltransferase [Thermodesulfobacteriota bacterium]